MTRIDFHDLPDDARLWIFGSDRELSDDEEGALLGEVDAFLEGWKAHGHPLSAGRSWRYGRFLLVAVDPSTVPPSGCSIDALTRRLRELEARFGLTLVDNAPVWYRRGEEIRRVDRPTFARLAESGEVTPATVVFDPTLTRLGRVREGGWEAPARETWHARAFFGGR